RLRGRRAGARAVDPGVAKVDVLGENVDLRAAQCGLEASRHHARLPGALGNPVLQLSTGSLEFAQSCLMGSSAARAVVGLVLHPNPSEKTAEQRRYHRPPPRVLLCIELATGSQPLGACDWMTPNRNSGFHPG